MACAEAVEAISGAEAAAALGRCADVSGCSLDELVQGIAYRLKTKGGEGVFVVQRHGSELWIQAGEGVASDGLTEAGLTLVQDMARALGCTSVGFETRRGGLVRKSGALGFQVAGYIMRKQVD